MRFSRFYSDHLPRGGNFGLLGFCYELRCAKIGGGTQINAKMEIILQENGGIHRKQHKVHFSIHVLSGFQRKMHGFISFDFISEEALFTFPFSRMGLCLAMYADGGTIYFHFFSGQFFNSVAGKL